MLYSRILNLVPTSRYWVMQNSGKFTDGGFFFHVPTVLAEPHGETATSAMTGEAAFSCILCFYKYFSTVLVGFTTSKTKYPYSIGPCMGYTVWVLR
eukprot:SAG11_NODE_1314_length_5223_cov_2.877244_3_plen_96_part_00